MQKRNLVIKNINQRNERNQRIKEDQTCNARELTIKNKTTHESDFFLIETYFFFVLDILFWEILFHIFLFCGLVLLIIL